MTGQEFGNQDGSKVGAVKIEQHPFQFTRAGAEAGAMPDAAKLPVLLLRLEEIMERTLAVHETLTDSFINHQFALH